ncbi:tetracycline resistance MFS efflux pump [Arenicella chitinivorans]|uniref:Tetracycline resistance MFS efflux pump n=1 Tax=Arenicella chitinivorans TaxID=1329800 RepID=A0A918VH86_9GAMM|nr:MFS transporter [Arenicella chitinivorans]GGZ96511.1 tetracycline resistance MFS efflux pump [Arenicella chitinivorans]
MIDTLQQKRATRFVLLTVFAYAIGFGIIMPVLPELIVELEQVSLSEATWIGGLIAASYAVFQFLMGPLVGNLGDRFGRRPVFLASLAGFSVDFFLMGFAQNILWLFIGRSIAGALGAIFGPANAVMADISSAQDRAKRFGMVGAAFGIGFMVGPALGGLLGDIGTRVPFFVASALAACVFVYGLVAFPETMPASSRRSFSLRRANPVGALLSLKQVPGVLGIAAVYFIWVTSTNIYPVSWAYFAPIKFGWDSKMVGLSLTLVGISMALVQMLLLGRVVARWGERGAAIIGLSSATLSMLFYAFTNSALLTLVVCLVVGIQGMVMPSINAMMSQRTPVDSQGELQGFNGSLAALAALAAPLIYNTTLSYFTAADAAVHFPGAPFIVSSILAVIALVAITRLNTATALATE